MSWALLSMELMVPPLEELRQTMMVLELVALMKRPASLEGAKLD
jgi:hypothetical protein